MFETVLGKDRDEVLIEERIHTFVLVIRTDRNEQKVERFGFLGLKCPQNVEPTEGEQLTAALTYGTGDLRHTESDTYHLVFLVHDDGHEIEVEQRQVHITVVLFLALGHGLEVIQLLVSRIDDIHVLGAESTSQFTYALDLNHMHVRTLFNDIRYTGHAFRTLLRREDTHLDPVRLFGQTIGIHMLDVIWVVIKRRQRSTVLISFEEQTLMVKIRKTYRTVQFIHTTFLTPGSNGVEQRFADLQIIDEIEPTEAHFLHAPMLIGTAVNDTADTSYGFTVPIGHPELIVTHLQSRVLGRVKAVHLIEEQRRTVIRTVLEQIIRKLDEAFDLFFRMDFADFYSHNLFVLFVEHRGVENCLWQ